jgi:hypothetical protein
MHTGIKTYENGTKEEKQFESREAMVEWLAESPEAGIAGYENGFAIPQRELQDEVEAAQ